jgi:hypothetical protein
MPRDVFIARKGKSTGRKLKVQGSFKGASRELQGSFKGAAPSGALEWWSDGVLGKGKSSAPSLHYSITPPFDL